MSDHSPRRAGPRFTIRYDLGTVGAWVRILIGVVASLALLAIDVPSVDFVFLAETAAWIIGILAAYTGVYVLLAPRVLPRLNAWVSTVIFYGPVLVLPYIDALPSTFRIGLSSYVILSIVVVVFIRYGGCEVVGIPSLVVRRRHVIYCPWNTIDLIDKAILDSRWSSQLQGRAVKVAGVLVSVLVVVVGGFLLNEAFPVVWLLTAVGSVLVVAMSVFISRSLARTAD